MTWTLPRSWATDDLVDETMMNQQVRDNLLYLHSGRPGATVARDNNASYSTSSLNFVNIDGTNLSLTITTTGGKVLVLFTGAFSEAGSLALNVYLDIAVDGTRIGAAGAYGLCKASLNNTAQTLSIAKVVMGLAAGAHTFTVQWMVDSSVAYLLAGNGVGGQDGIPIFSVEEIG